MPERSWTCQRVISGVRCGHRNPARKRNCMLCGKPRPARRKPAHRRALDLSYEQYIELNGGEHCALCGRLPGTRRFDRDHCHRTGRPRGLLCHRCNRALASWMDREWLIAAIDYLERTEAS